jgi:hypothetical protein
MSLCKEIEREIESWKKVVLSKVCRRCEGRCCKEGANIVGLSEEQARLIFGDFENKSLIGSIGQQLVLKTEEGYDTNYRRGDACPQLKNGRCKIHKNTLRPEVCEQYPVFQDHKEKKVRFSGECPACEFEYSIDFFERIIDIGYDVYISGKRISQEELDFQREIEFKYEQR